MTIQTTDDQKKLNDLFLADCYYSISGIVKDHLDKGADINAKDKRGRSALQLSFSWLDIKKTKFLCSHKDISKEHKTQALIVAILMYDGELIKALVESGAYVDERYFNMEYLKRIAAEKGVTLPIGAAK